MQVRRSCHRAGSGPRRECSTCRRPRFCNQAPIIEHAGATVEIAGTPVAMSDIPHFSEESCLLPEIDSLLTAKEHVEAVGMTGAVMARETVQAEPEEYAADIRRDFIDPVQTVQTF